MTFYAGSDFLGGVSVSMRGLKHPWDAAAA